MFSKLFKNRTFLGALAGAATGTLIGGIIGLVLGGEAAAELAIYCATGGFVLGVILGAIAGDPKKVFGSKNDRQLKKLRPLVARINAFEEEIQALEDAQLRAKTVAFRERIRQATSSEREELERLKAELRGDVEREHGDAEQLREAITKQEDALYKAERDVLDEILPEAFACVREASRRTIGLRHYDVQMIGGIVLHQGTIAEMKTGEGKTLVATLPIYLNALTGRGVHLVTVNDYLARRDVQWMGPIYHGLGLGVSAIVHEASFEFDPSYVATTE